MEFQAYPKSPKGRMSPVWEIQNMLHSNDSMVLPGALLLAASLVVFYEHMTHAGNTSMRNFILMIIVTMLPLAILEKKVFSCSDPVGAFRKFSTKVLLMHVFFLVGHALLGQGNFCFLIAASILLPTVFGLRFTRKSMHDHLDVWYMLLMICLAAAFTEAFSLYWQYNSMNIFRKMILSRTLDSTSFYIEVLAFVPAIWTVCRTCKDATAAKSVDIEDTKKQAVCFLAFLLAFYVQEDIYYGVYQGWNQVMGTLGHTAHFLLFLDFAAFLLAHFYDSDKLEKLIAPLMNFFSDASCQV